MYGLTQTERGMSVQQIQQTSALDPTAPITGQQPFAQILCAVPGSPTPKPHNAAWYEGLYRTKFPSLEDYMEKMSGCMVQIYWLFSRFYLRKHVLFALIRIAVLY
jgi:hypothetical protein